MTWLIKYAYLPKIILVFIASDRYVRCSSIPSLELVMSPCHTEVRVAGVPFTTGNITGMIKCTYRIPWISNFTFHLSSIMSEQHMETDKFM